MILDKRTVLEAAARGYCTPTNSHKELDAELLTAVVDEILRALAAEQPENSQQVGMSRTPETDAIDATADQNYGTDMYSDMLGHARRKEREVAYWKQEFYRVEKMVLSEQDRVEELERQLAAAEEEGPALPEGNEEFSQREAKRIVNSADAQCFRWLLKHHSGFGKAMAGVGMRCWIGGIEFIGDDVATAILDAIDREEAAAPSGGGGKA